MWEYKCEACGNCDDFDVLQHPSNRTRAVLCNECGNIWLSTDPEENCDAPLNKE